MCIKAESFDGTTVSSKGSGSGAEEDSQAGSGQCAASPSLSSCNMRTCLRADGTPCSEAPFASCQSIQVKIGEQPYVWNGARQDEMRHHEM